MSDEHVSRWMGPIGLATVVLLFLGFGPLGGNAPGENASGASVAAYYNAHVARSWASVYVVGLGLALFVVFVSNLRSVLRDGGRQRALPNVVFAAGILLVGGIVAAGTDQVVLILAAHNHEYGIVKLANFFSDNNALPFLFGIALLTLAVGAAVLLNRAVPLPRTLGWYSLLVGVVSCLGPVGFFAFLFGFPIWLVATGFVISVKARRAVVGTIPAGLAGTGAA